MWEGTVVIMDIEWYSKCGLFPDSKMTLNNRIEKHLETFTVTWKSCHMYME